MGMFAIMAAGEPESFHDTLEEAEARLPAVKADYPLSAADGEVYILGDVEPSEREAEEG